MATVIRTKPRIAARHFGLYRTSVGGDEPIIVRRKVGEPTDVMHLNSAETQRQRRRFTEASQHYASFTPPQKWLSRRQMKYVSYVRNHGKSKIKLLQGRQLVISEDVRSLKTTGRLTTPPYSICIIMCDPDYNPLAGTLYLKYYEDGTWHDVEGMELDLGNWLFREVPPGKEYYRVEGEAPGFVDPETSESQYITEAKLKLYHWHVMVLYMGETLWSFPDPSREKSSVDGYVSKYSHNTWAVQWGGYAEQWSDSVGTFIVGIARSYMSGRWQRLSRFIYLFDTRLLPPDCEIVAAEFQVRCESKVQAGGMDGAFNLFPSNPNSDILITKYDYANLGSTPLATEIPFANIKDDELNIWHLNEAGLAHIEKEGITKLSLRESRYDAPNNEPEWDPDAMCYIGAYFADSSDIRRRPRLVITYKV